MRDIIIAYPIKETALQLRSVLEDYGLHSRYVCGTGAGVLGIASDMHGGIIICASILRDMSVVTLAERLPAGFDIIALSHNGVEEYMSNIVSMPLPLNRAEFIETVQMLAVSYSSFTQRSSDDDRLISQAKAILMSTNDITEMQAHKCLQRESMKKGKTLVQVAKEIIYEFN